MVEISYREELWRCEMCDQDNSECACPGGPWNDVDAAFAFMQAQCAAETLRANAAEANLERLRGLLREAADSDWPWPNELCHRIDAELEALKDPMPHENASNER